MDINRISNEIISKLNSSGIIERINDIEIQENPNRSIIDKMFSSPSKIFLDDGGLYFFENEDKIYCPEIKVTISEKGEWISDMIPNVNFDIDQSGNVRKAEEAESLFCLIIISHVLKDNIFKNELDNLIKQYDFVEMKNVNNNGPNFVNLLSDWQGMQSIVVNILVSACRYRLSDYKKDAEKFLKSGLKDLEVVGLRDLESQIRKINFEYSEGVLAPSEVKKLTKIERLFKIDERDSKINNLISNSKFGTLYKILKLSSEYINPIKKKKIQIWVDSEVTKILNNDSFNHLKEERTQIVSQLTRRAIRLEKNSVRKINIEKYIKDRENYKIPVKM